MSSDEDEEQLEVSEDDDDVSEDDDDFPNPRLMRHAPRPKLKRTYGMCLSRSLFRELKSVRPMTKKQVVRRRKIGFSVAHWGSKREAEISLANPLPLSRSSAASFFAHHENTTATRFTQSITHGKRLDAALAQGRWSAAGHRESACPRLRASHRSSCQCRSTRVLGSATRARAHQALSRGASRCSKRVT